MKLTRGKNTILRFSSSLWHWPPPFVSNHLYRNNVNLAKGRNAIPVMHPYEASAPTARGQWESTTHVLSGSVSPEWWQTPRPRVHIEKCLRWLKAHMPATCNLQLTIDRWDVGGDPVCRFALRCEAEGLRLLNSVLTVTDAVREDCSCLSFYTNFSFHCTSLPTTSDLCMRVCITDEWSPQWRAADAEIEISSVENTELKGSPFKAWDRSVRSHATLTAGDCFFANFYPFGPFTCIFCKTSPEFFLC